MEAAVQQNLQHLQLSFRQNPPPWTAELAKQGPREFPEQDPVMVDQNLSRDCVASLGHRRQRKTQEWRQVVSALAGLEQSAQVLIFVVVVVIGQADHYPIVDAGLPEHKGFHGPGGAAVAVAKGVHCPEMVVGRHGLDNSIVLSELPADGVAKGLKSTLATLAAVRSPADWRSEGDIVLVSLGALRARSGRLHSR